MEKQRGQNVRLLKPQVRPSQKNSILYFDMILYEEIKVFFISKLFLSYVLISNNYK